MWSPLGSPDPDGARGFMQYLEVGLIPVSAPNCLTIAWNRKIKHSSWLELVKEHESKTLRQIAKEYGVSHETVRRTLNVA
jgi:hypothetical protein